MPGCPQLTMLPNLTLNLYIPNLGTASILPCPASIFTQY